MEQERDPEQELEHATRELESRIEGLSERVDQTRQDWERKRDDDAVPGAVPREAGSDTPPAGAPTGGAGKREETKE